MNFRDADKVVSKIVNAGSVFVGPFTPESAGDYASGTNHSLPTYGYAKSVGGVSVEMFMKGMTVQNISREGLENISESIIELAEIEELKSACKCSSGEVQMMNIEKLVRSNIQKLKPYTSARDSHLSGILLDANENSLGSVIESNLELNRYPDPAQTALRGKLGEVLSIPANRLFFGVGSDEIIDLLIRIFCEPAVDNVLIPEPTYGMYKVSCDINNVSSQEIPLDDEFQPDVKSILSKVDENTKMIFLCSPNNPTGNVLDKEKIEQLLNSYEGIVVIDEAYIDFDYERSFHNMVEQFNNLILLRTFSKAWGLAGVRCGYCIAGDEVINYLFKVKAPYNMNKLTADAILHALDNIELRNNFIALLKSERERVSAELDSIEKVEKVFPSSGNFVLFKIPNAKNIYNELAESGIIIRDRSSQLNLEDCLRVSIGTQAENDKFLNTLKSIV